MKEKYFEEELLYIENNDIKESLITLINLLPNYFFTIEASSSGKYHPPYALGVGGLLRHTKAAVKIAYELFNNETICNFTSREKDLIILSLIMHDGVKRGDLENSHTKTEHPLLASKLIIDNECKLKLTSEDINIVVGAINSHMGQWNTDFYKKEILPKPNTEIEKFVHLCDYLASRKFLEVSFDENNKIRN